MPEQKPITQQVENAEVIDNTLSGKNPDSITVTQSLEISSSPYPAPEVMRKYKTIDKAFPQHFMRTSQREQLFRHVATFIGMISTIAIAIIGFGAAAYSGAHGADITGGAIAAATAYSIYVLKSVKPKHPNHNGKESEKKD